MRPATEAEVKRPVTIVYLEHQREDKTFAVFVGGDDDMEGDYDRLFSYGLIDNRKVTIRAARKAALEYGETVARKFSGGLAVWLRPQA